MNLPSKILLLLLIGVIGLISKNALAVNHPTKQATCIEMMKMHYALHGLGKFEAADKQLAVAARACLPIINNDTERQKLEIQILNDQELIDLFDVLKVSPSTSP